MAKLSTESLLSELAALHDETWNALDAAKAAGDLGHVLSAIREGRSNVESYSRLSVDAALEERVRTLEEGVGAHVDRNTS